MQKREHVHQWLDDLDFTQQLNELCSRAWQGIANDGARGLRSEMSLFFGAMLSVGYTRGWNAAIDAAIEEVQRQGTSDEAHR